MSDPSLDALRQLRRKAMEDRLVRDVDRGVERGLRPVTGGDDTSAALADLDARLGESLDPNKLAPVAAREVEPVRPYGEAETAQLDRDLGKSLDPRALAPSSVAGALAKKDPYTYPSGEMEPSTDEDVAYDEKDPGERERRLRELRDFPLGG